MMAAVRRFRPGRWLIGGVLLLLSLLLLLQFWFLAHLFIWRTEPPGSTAFMRAQLAVLREKDPRRELDYRWVDYARISPHLKRAVIAAEDARFPDHDGVDWDAIEKAWDRNSQKGRIALGGSTISMQLAKNLFLSGERSYLRKAQELVITLMMERVMDKQRILELYLNVAEWGVGIFGAEAAARHYFGVSAAQLSVEQGARLAAMLPRPRYHDLNRGNTSLARRTAMIQRRMNSVAVP